MCRGCCPSHSWRTCVYWHRGCLIFVCCGETFPCRDWGSAGLPSAWSSCHPPAAHTHCPVDSRCQPLFWDWVKEQSLYPSCAGYLYLRTCLLGLTCGSWRICGGPRLLCSSERSRGCSLLGPPCAAACLCGTSLSGCSPCCEMRMWRKWCYLHWPQAEAGRASALPVWSHPQAGAGV